ncbi:NB-ARC domain-containing protein [Kitasatospora sp. NPDC054939]
MGRRRRGLLGVLAAVVVLDGSLLALAVNAATEDKRWPGVLDALRTHAWWSVAALTLLGVVVGLLVRRLERPTAVDGDPPPPPAPAVDPWLVPRAELRATVGAVLARGSRTVGLTTSLQGAGGFGKTRLARMVCADRRVRRHFRGRVYLVAIGRDVRSAADVAAKVGEVTRLITGDDQTFTDPDMAGAHLGRLLEQRPRTLLVLDDVWEEGQLAPFLLGAPQCVRLVTTRRARLVGSASARSIRVDRMTEEESRRVLLQDLRDLSAEAVEELLTETGRWPLLLRLVNRLIAAQVATGLPVEQSARAAARRLREQGPAAADEAGMDSALSVQRERAVEATIEAAVDLLPAGGRDRYRELGIFAEDETVPVDLVCLLWEAGSGLAADQGRALVGALADLSLITLDPAHGGRIGLHDVHRDYLRSTLGADGLTAANGHLVDAVTARLPPAAPLAPGTPDPRHAWWETVHGYLLDHAVHHLLAAGRTATAEDLASDLRWIERRLLRRGANAPIADLLQVPTPDAAARARDLTQAAHLLQRTTPEHALSSVLHSRLNDLPHWQDQTAARIGQHTHPGLSNAWPLPDLPHPALRLALPTAGRASAVVISPDGTWFATASDGVQLWDRATGARTAELIDHTEQVNAVAISPDGTWLATACADGTVRLWEYATGTQTAELTGHTDRAMAVAISPDGTWLATGDYDGPVRLWDRATGTQTAQLTGHTDRVTSVAISPDATWLASGSYDGTIRLWDPATGAQTAELTGHTEQVNAVAISPDGTWLATGDYDGPVRLWDRATGTQTTQLTGHTNSVMGVAISSDGTWLATASADGTVRLWDRATGTQTARLTSHTGWVRSVVISPDGTWLASAGVDRTVRLWDRTAGNRAAEDTAQVLSVAFAPDGTWLATGSDDGTVLLRDSATGTRTTRLTGHIDWVRSVVISPDGTWLASAGDDRTVRLWDRATGTQTAELTGHTDRAMAVAISPDGTWLATTSSDRTVRLWDRATGTQTAELTGHTSAVLAVAISPDGARLATGCFDGTVRVWQIPSGEAAAVMHVDGSITCCAWSPDGSTIAAGGQAGLYLFRFDPGTA